MKDKLNIQCSPAGSFGGTNFLMESPNTKIRGGVNPIDFIVTAAAAVKTLTSSFQRLTVYSLIFGALTADCV